MQGSEVLTTIAQLALGLAGFSGVVIALDHEPTQISRVGAFRLNVLLLTSGGAMFLAIAPLGLQHFGLSEAEIWKLASILQAIFALGFLLWFWPATLATRKIAPEIFHTTVMMTYFGGNLLNLVLQIIAALGLVENQAIGIYLLGLMWLLFNSFLQFRRMLLVHQSKHRNDKNLFRKRGAQR